MHVVSCTSFGSCQAGCNVAPYGRALLQGQTELVEPSTFHTVLVKLRVQSTGPDVGTKYSIKLALYLVPYVQYVYFYGLPAVCE